MKNIKNYISGFIIFFFTVSLAFDISAQTTKDTLFVEGVILDAATQKPIQGVLVNVNNTFSSITDESGSYKVQTTSTKLMMTVTAPGYLKREIPIKTKTKIDINLYKDFFINYDKDANAYYKSLSLSVEDELSTRLAKDVRVVKRSGQAGVGSNLFIRGFNTLNSSSKPLIVVDGVIWNDYNNINSAVEGFNNSMLNDINLTDIESVEVLKNGNSIYGSKGSNGVIEIKTLRATNPATRITFDANYGFVQQPNLTPVMDASEYRTYATDVLKNAGYSTTALNKMEMLNDDPSSLTYNKYHNNTNWGDVVYQPGSTQKYGLRVEGGDDVAMYGFTVGYTGVNGQISNTGMSRLNTRFNSDIKLSNSINVASNISFVQTDFELRDDGVDAITSPGYIAMIKSPIFSPYKYTTVTGVLTDKLETVDDVNVSNPLSVIENGIGKNKNYRFNLSVEPVWSINKDFKLKSLFAYSIRKIKEHYYSPMNGVTPMYLTNYGVSYNAVKDQTIQQISVFNDTRLAYSHVFDKTHFVDASIGLRTLDDTYESDFGEGHNTGGDYITNLLYSLSYKNVGGLNDKWNSMSLYAQANYNYLNKYSVWVAASNDNSSRFGSATKTGTSVFGSTWATFPSVGASWLVSSESFMKNINFIDKLNLRTSFGITGNDNIGNYQRDAYFLPVNYMGVAVGLKVANLENQSLQWETTSKMDAGIDLSIFDERINISADVYKNKTSNLLVMKQNSIASGLDAYWTNEGDMQNMGYELSLGAKLVNAKILKWNLSVSAANYVNKIIYLPNGNYTTNLYGAEVLTSLNNPAGLFYGYKSLGVFATDEEAKAAYGTTGLLKQNDNASYSAFGAGDVHFDDLDDNGIINEKDKQIIGNPNPDLTGSIMNTVSYKNFTLDVAMTYSLGNDIYNYQRSQLESMSNLHNQSAAVINRWKANGQITDVPKATYGDPMGNGRFSDRWIEDGSYLKIQNVRLSYDVPLKSNFIVGLTVYASASNLYTFTKYLGSDPENAVSSSVLLQGIDNGLLPSSRVFNLGIKLNL